MPKTSPETEICIASALEAFHCRDKPILRHLDLDFSISYTLGRRVRGTGPSTARIPTDRALNIGKQSVRKSAVFYRNLAELHPWI
ncbi:hypothetical protein N7467_003492 [Penicillium canescens]|nr:hypothetical protein N7467_003492 [Penicillium canescens]